MRLYVSGPMSGLPEFNYPAFHDAEARLIVAGFAVVSPADLPIRDDWEWVDYILADIASVFSVDGIATLLGCESSKGSRIECEIAEQRGIPIRPVERWVALGPSAGQETTALAEAEVGGGDTQDHEHPTGQSAGSVSMKQDPGASASASAVLQETTALSEPPWGLAEATGNPGCCPANGAADTGGGSPSAVHSPQETTTLAEGKPSGMDMETAKGGTPRTGHLSDVSANVPAGTEDNVRFPSASAVPFDHAAALARARADGRDYMRRRT